MSIPSQSEVFLRKDIEAILEALESVIIVSGAEMNPIQVINAARIAFHIETQPAHRYTILTEKDRPAIPTHLWK